MGDLIGRLLSYTNVREPLVAGRHDVIWPMSDLREVAAALADAQATIARLEAALREAREWIDDWPDPRYGTKEEADWRDEVLAQIDAALAQGKGDG